jgi:hypothetical protein
VVFVTSNFTSKTHALAHELRHGDLVGNPVQFYRQVLRALREADLPFLIGGAYAMARYTQIDRTTKDLDLMIRRADWPPIARVLREHGIYTRLSFPHWLGKALQGTAQVDIIFSSGNAIASVDDEWFRRGVPARVLGFQVQLAPPEELLWSKAFVMERERFDGADVLHLILRMGRSFDWLHLCDRFTGHERVLLTHLLLFGYVYPDDADIVPAWVLRRLYAAPIASGQPGVRLCRGPILSRAQYLVDVEKWGYADARLPPFGRLAPRENDIWTRAIRAHWSRRRQVAV